MLQQDDLKKILSQKLFVGLDRDGTLVPIVEDPETSPLAQEDASLLDSLACLPDVTVAIVSARSSSFLHRDIKSDRLIYAGNYGMEIRFPGGRTFTHPQAQSCRGELARMKNCLLRSVARVPGAILEDHGLSLCLHVHKLKHSARCTIAGTVAGLKQEFPTLSLRSLPTSFEVVPALEWNKSCALEEIERASLIDRGDQSYVFAGDSPTDEAAFEWVNLRGGVSIRVGGAAESRARYHLASPAQLWQLLRQLHVQRQGTV